jgi:hypothetical protein
VSAPSDQEQLWAGFTLESTTLPKAHAMKASSLEHHARGLRWDELVPHVVAQAPEQTPVLLTISIN